MTTQTVSLSKDEKIKRVIDLTEQGKPLEDISDELGYSQPKNLIRFMARSQFKFDADHHQFIHQANLTQKKETKKERQEPVHQEVNDDKNEEREDEEKSDEKAESSEKHQIEINDKVVNLLQQDKVLELLKHAGDILEVIEEERSGDKSKDMTSKTLSMSQMYKDAQFYHRQVTSVTKSFRVPIDLDSRLQDFCEETGLNQKQVVCLAIDYFLNHQHFLEKFSEDEHKEESPS